MTGWTWIAASRRGSAHAQAGERRQDACRVLTAAPGFLIAVACDGAGSAVFGGYGAALAARMLTNRAADWIAKAGALPSPEIVELWVAEVRLMLVVSADRLDCVPGDYAATLVLAISYGASTITAHIGDGAIVARQPGSSDLTALSWPESGEYASTTYFITDIAPRLRIGVIRDFPLDRLALLTDGIERLALDFVGRVPHRPFFDGLFKAVSANGSVGANRPLSRQLAAFLDSDSVSARTDDDKTLILAALV